MAPVKNGRVIYQAVPEGYPIPGQTVVYDDSEVVDLDTVPLNGGTLLKVLLVSVDPYLRRKMWDPSKPSNLSEFQIGDTIENYGVGVVLRSDNPQYKQGDHIVAIIPFQEYVIVHELKRGRLIENKENLPWSVYVGVCGMPGQTAHHGWKAFAKTKKGDTVFVTAAAGAVGATVVQLAKADGLKVIASAGSDEKVEYVKTLGADVVFNYKTTKTAEVIAKEGPINIYWDNVGGESLEAALEYAAHHATFIICGNISGYNTKEPYNVKTLQQLVWHEITFHGFLVWSLATRPGFEDDFYATMPARVARGEIKYREHVVRDGGLASAGQAIVDVMQGRNFGKSVIIVADE